MSSLTPIHSTNQPTSMPPPAPLSGLAAVLAYHGLGPRKVGAIRSLPALKFYIREQLILLRGEFHTEIAAIAARKAEFPLIQQITFSNIDEFVEVALMGMEQGKQTLTWVRAAAAVYMRGVLAIARDLEEEITLITGGGVVAAPTPAPATNVALP
ncbi:hypothetical protein DRE_01109 [Drechslerella stenobrocha 248]|uniref:Uncharacterized protein n=1 Tax=Drechslerella stenobrocha 248 TaxID=1043628 RepID=W7HWI1_9PEZI|nr:hypothetical protein DRE_01109 [Drechslerella stenobrocha 248]